MNKKIKRISVAAFASFCLLGGTFAQAEPSSITLKYDTFKDANWNLNGEAAQLRGGSNDGFVQLTTSQAYVVGSMFYKNPIPFSADRSFSAYFVTKMTNAGNGGADGVVFVISAKTDTNGKDGGGIGYSGLKDSIGIELDTWDNFAALGDPDGNHIAVNVNGDLSKPLAVTAKGALSKRGITLDDGLPKHVWVEYNGSTKTLEVRIASDEKRPSASDLTVTKLDLTTVLPNGPLYAGFTSATGGAFANHYVNMLYLDTQYRQDGLTKAMELVQNERPAVPSKSYMIEEDGTPLLDTILGTDRDQNPLTYKIFEAPKNGRVELNEKTGAFSYIPNPDFSGNDAFKVVAFDGLVYSLPGEQTIQIVPKNDPPVVDPQVLESLLGQPVDSKLIARDADGNPLSYRLLTNPSKGTVNIDPASGSLRYVPNPGASGIDSFEVVVNDGVVNSAPATVKVMITSPLEAKPQQKTGDQGTPVDGQLDGKSTDSQPVKLKYVITKQPENGKVELADNGLYRYTPNPGFTGTDRFEFAVDDGKQISSPAIVEIKIQPRPAAAEAPQIVTLKHSSYMVGYPDGEFKQVKAISRGELAAAVIRLTGLKNTSGKTVAFKDVKSGNWMYRDAVLAHLNGLVKADSKMQFMPNHAITRGEIRAVVQRLVNQKRVTADKLAVAQRQVAWLGQTAQAAKSNQSVKVSRLEAVLILNRLFDRGPLSGDVEEMWLDVSSSDPNYGEIMEASVSHESVLKDGKEVFSKLIK